MTGHYGSGKTHLFHAQYGEVAVARKTRCHVRTKRELVEELKTIELDSEFVSPVMTATKTGDRPRNPRSRFQCVARLA